MVPNYALMANIYALAAALRRLSEALYLTTCEPPIEALLVKLNDTVLAYEALVLLAQEGASFIPQSGKPLTTPAVLFVIVTPFLFPSSVTVHPALLADMAPPWIAA